MFWCVYLPVCIMYFIYNGWFSDVSLSTCTKVLCIVYSGQNQVLYYSCPNVYHAKLGQAGSALKGHVRLFFNSYPCLFFKSVIHCHPQILVMTIPSCAVSQNILQLFEVEFIALTPVGLLSKAHKIPGNFWTTFSGNLWSNMVQVTFLRNVHLVNRSSCNIWTIDLSYFVIIVEKFPQ